LRCRLHFLGYTLVIIPQQLLIEAYTRLDLTERGHESKDLTKGREGVMRHPKKEHQGRRKIPCKSLGKEGKEARTTGIR
jgi:hypothetical protein